VQVAPTPPAAGTVTGSARLTIDGNDTPSSVMLSSSGQAQFVISNLSLVSPHTITARYNGDNHFHPSTSAPPLSITVIKADTSVSVTANPVMPPGSVFGQGVTFAATVNVTSPGSGAPTGTVTFFDGAVGTGTNLGTATLVGSTATLTPAVTSLSAGTHTIT